MTRLQALKELARKVEAGEYLSGNVAFWGALNIAFERRGALAAEAAKAYYGSLDAAQALHEALLPEWHFDIDSEAGGVCVFKSALDSAELGKCECLARSWLLAIIKALIAQEEE